MLDLVGRELDGRYRFKACIGQSDCAWVWRARHLKTKRRVAIKLLRPACLDDLALVTRLEQEGVLGARIHSDEVVSIFDQGSSCIGPYVVMDWVQGESLAQRLHQDHAQAGPWSPSQVLHFSKALARGLVAMHSAGVVHRDLKPSNIMVLGTGPSLRIKIIDFGVAKALLQPGTTAVGRTLGTASYMAPEQALDAASVDERADLYAFGVIFHQLLAGQDAPPDPGGAQSYLDGLSQNWRSLALDLIATEPQLRPASAKVLLSRLEALTPKRFAGRRKSSRPAPHWPWVLSAGVGLGAGLYFAPSSPSPSAQASNARPAGARSWVEPQLSLQASHEGPRCLDLPGGAKPLPEPGAGAKEGSKTATPDPESSSQTPPKRPNVLSASLARASGPRDEGSPAAGQTELAPSLPPALPAELGELRQEGPGTSTPQPRPSPTKGLIGAGQELWTTSRRSAPMGFFDARQYCEGLSHGSGSGLVWRLASPQEVGQWRGVKGIKQGWYWADEVRGGKAVVVALPSNRRFTARVRRRFIRPFCVTKSP